MIKTEKWNAYCFDSIQKKICLIFKKVSKKNKKK